MSATVAAASAQEIVYPDCDGQPMSDDTKQFRWIVTIEGGLEALYAGDPNVFVAGDLLWYPVEGRPDIRSAPDALVVFGRPKGDRGSYIQWREENIALQVVFEVLSPGNRLAGLLRKFAFYDRYGVEEYYVYDPDSIELTGWRRVEGRLEEIPQMAGWVSPRLGVRFELEGGELVLYRPDGRRFSTFLELTQEHEELTQQHEQALAQRNQAQEMADREAQRAAKAEAEVTRLRALLEPQGGPVLPPGQ